MLKGTEVRSIKEGKASLVDSFCYFDKGELYVKGIDISEGKFFPHEAKRDRKLLLKKNELGKLEDDLVKGTSIIVKKIFFNERGKVKLEIALARGKKEYDKRNSIKERELDRDMRSY